jgi:hypothetical protein
MRRSTMFHTELFLCFLCRLPRTRDAGSSRVPKDCRTEKSHLFHTTRSRPGRESIPGRLNNIPQLTDSDIHYTTGAIINVNTIILMLAFVNTVSLSLCPPSSLIRFLLPGNFQQLIVTFITCAIPAVSRAFTRTPRQSSRNSRRES